jgi:hypothetical protein
MLKKLEVIWATDKIERSKSEIAQAYGISFSSLQPAVLPEIRKSEERKC